MSNIEQTSIEDYMNAEHAVTDFTKDGKCSQCGGCCSKMLPLSDSEIERIKKFVKKKKLKPHKLPVNPLLVDQPIDCTCPFLRFNNDDRGTWCSIYSVRPDICKAFTCNKDDGQVATDLSKSDLDKYKSLPPRAVVDMWETFFPDKK